MPDLSAEQLQYVLRFQHPEKTMAALPGVTNDTVAALFGMTPGEYHLARASFTRRAAQSADELLEDERFAGRVDALPFKPGQTVVGMGDSITDDYLSWFELLSMLYAKRHPGSTVRFVNAGISGDTTSQMLSRMLQVVQQEPEWILCMAGTNDARRHGPALKVLVSPGETAANLATLRHFGCTRTPCQWVWMTPTPVLEEKIAADWFLGQFELRWTNADIAAVADIVRRMPDTVVDLQATFGACPREDWLLPDGLHPSLTGHRAIVRALVNTLAKDARA